MEASTLANKILINCHDSVFQWIHPHPKPPSGVILFLLIAMLHLLLRTAPRKRFFPALARKKNFSHDLLLVAMGNKAEASQRKYYGKIRWEMFFPAKKKSAAKLFVKRFSASFFESCWLCCVRIPPNYLMFCCSVGTEMLYTESNQVNEKRGFDGRKRKLTPGEMACREREKRHAMCSSRMWLQWRACSLNFSFNQAAVRWKNGII